MRIIVCHFGRFRSAVYLLFLTILAVFGGRYIHYFQPFWPFSEGGGFITFGHFWAFSEGGILIIFGHFGPDQRAVELSFSAILAVLGGWFAYYFRPFWLFPEGGRVIILGHFGRFRRAVYSLFFGHFGPDRRAVDLSFLAILAVLGGWYAYYFRPFWPFPEGGIFVIFAHFGRFWRAVYLLFSAILAVFGGRYMYYFRPF